jgi:hypothetical protein
MNDLTTRLQRLIASSRGLDEPTFDVELRIVNWPENLERELTDLVAGLQSSTNDRDLRACADLLNQYDLSGVPEGLLQILSRAIVDNPNTPLRED